MTEKLYPCPCCKKSYPLSHFIKSSKKCKTCRVALNKAWKERNPEKARQMAREAQARYRKRHKEKCRERHEKWRQEHPEQWKALRNKAKKSYKARPKQLTLELHSPDTSEPSPDQTA